MLPKLNELSSNKPQKKNVRKTAKQLSEEHIREINDSRTKLPKTEMDSANNRPVLNIPGMDDLDIKSSFNDLLGKDYGKTEEYGGDK